MSAYFHQDWILDGGESSDTVRAFLAAEKSQLVIDCAQEIDDLLGEKLAEGEIERRLTSWGAQYRAGDTDADYRSWLIEIRDQIRASASS
ncbi:hypothetical protein EUA93_10970 [Nocardioides oleivorans]|uniref:CdiI immunity protein domain-containing protein n=2 Tax=Nocardioides oleivorans TaxID=273676 RepID=A0A4Q2S332_9ACTN|nr:hypothetical protein EUA93_10970 [Nocardioides oleivorans]